MTFELNEKGCWEGTETVSGNFNLHMEKEFNSAVNVLVATGGATKFAPCAVFREPAYVVDADFTGEVFDKTIKVECLAKGDVAPVATITEA